MTWDDSICWERNLILITLYMVCWPHVNKWPTILCQQDMSRKTSNISRTLVGDEIVDNSDVVGASPVGAAPTTSSFST